MKIKEVLGIGLAYLMQALIAVFIGIAIFERHYYGLFWGLIALFITFLPLMLKRKFRVTLPWTLNLLIALSLFLHVSGVVRGWYYTLHPFYDKFGHFISSVTIALLGFTSVLVIDWYTKVELTNKSILVFIVIFTLAVGTVWEIGEFASDKFFGTNAQKSLDDTMLDLIFDLAGGIVVAIVAMIKLRKERKNLLERMFEKLREKVV